MLAKTEMLECSLIIGKHKNINVSKHKKGTEMFANPQMLEDVFSDVWFEEC